MYIGLIGFGYWGRILYNNLIDLGYTNIIIYDINQGPYNKQLDNCDKIIIATPATTHKDWCEYFLALGKDILCEKPLSGNFETNQRLFDLAEKNSVALMVDWTFIFNNQVQFLHKFLQTKTVKSVNMNRLNLGPIRTDVNARLDLASHDVSILQYLFGSPIKKKWIDYCRNNKSKEADSCLGMLWYKNDMFAQINCSWHYCTKDRTCLFELEDGLLIWDDITKKITFNNNELRVDIETSSPLTNVLTQFLTNPYNDMRNITIQIEKVLHNDN